MVCLLCPFVMEWNDPSDGLDLNILSKSYRQLMPAAFCSFSAHSYSKKGENVKECNVPPLQYKGELFRRQVYKSSVLCSPSALKLAAEKSQTALRNAVIQKRFSEKLPKSMSSTCFPPKTIHLNHLWKFSNAVAFYTSPTFQL